MSQSFSAALPAATCTVTVPSPDRARSAVSLPPTTMLPSPVWTSSAPLTSRARMLPSPEFS